MNCSAERENTRQLISQLSMRSVVPCWSTISVETREAVQRRGGIEDFLDVGAERGPVDDGCDARGQDCADQQTNYMLQLLHLVLPSGLSAL